MRPPSRTRSSQEGLSLIELILFIVIVGVGVAALLSVFNVAVRGSADPLVRKQLLAVAESVMEEVTLQPFTYCDPSDAEVLTANDADVGAGNCATLAEAQGVSGGESGQSRYSASSPFNNVNDYAGFSMSPIRDLQNAVVVPLQNYSASVAITPAGDQFGLADAAALRIVVTASRLNSSEQLSLTGYRFRYAPNAPQ